MHKRLSLTPAALVLTALVVAMPLASVWSADETDKKTTDRKAASDLKKKLGKALTSGEVKDGRYELSQDEMAMDCQRMTGSMKITISRLRDAESRKGGSGPGRVGAQDHAADHPRLHGIRRSPDNDVARARQARRLQSPPRHAQLQDARHRCRAGPRQRTPLQKY